MKAKIPQMKNNGMDNMMSTPCTIAEAVQIARGVAEDVVADYQRRTSHVQVSMSLQMEILKDIVIKAGLITEEEFKERYIKEAERFNKMQQEAMRAQASEEVGELEPAESAPETTNPKMDVQVSDIEIKKG